MALRNILTGRDNSALRKKSREVKTISKRTLALLDDMKDTMHHDEGVGLAAPQVGVLRRIAVIEFENEYFEILNPVITKRNGEETEDEGCLSVPGVRGYVVRPHSITVEYMDRYAAQKEIELTGMLARIFCHEMDHLDGVLFVDKIVEAPQEEKTEETE